MILVLVGLVLGAAWGAWRAKARNGRRLDILQYAAVHAMIFGLIGLFLAILIFRASI